jgi:hypothetical protein
MTSSSTLATSSSSVCRRRTCTSPGKRENRMPRAVLAPLTDPCFPPSVQLRHVPEGVRGRAVAPAGVAR